MNGGANTTKHILCESFKQLLQECPFESITIKKITDRAGVIRPTFYTYFRDKQEVYEWMLREELMATLYTLLENNMDREALKMIFFYFGNNRSTYKHLFKIHGQNGFKWVLFRQLLEFYKAHISKGGYHLNEKVRLLSLENLARFYTGGMINLLELWLTSDDLHAESSDELFEAYTFLLTHSFDDILHEK